MKSSPFKATATRAFRVGFEAGPILSMAGSPMRVTLDAMSMIEFTDVAKIYGERVALGDVSFHLPEGSVLGLLGPNGAGKTTALRLILGLIEPSSGTVRLQGQSPYRRESRQGVGYLPERIGFPQRISVRAFLRLHAGLAGLDSGEARREVSEIAEQTDIADRLGEPLGSLSKGLAQRVGFAQALLGRPKLLLLDEPGSGLDPIGIRAARDWIQVARQRGCSVLLSSHQLSEVERICDRVVILREGCVLAEGSLSQIVLQGEELEDAFVRLVTDAPPKKVIPLGE